MIIKKITGSHYLLIVNNDIRVKEKDTKATCVNQNSMKGCDNCEARIIFGPQKIDTIFVKPSHSRYRSKKFNISFL